MPILCTPITKRSKKTTRALNSVGTSLWFCHRWWSSTILLTEKDRKEMVFSPSRVFSSLNDWWPATNINRQTKEEKRASGIHFCNKCTFLTWRVQTEAILDILRLVIPVLRIFFFLVCTAEWTKDSWPLWPRRPRRSTSLWQLLQCYVC